MDSGWVTGGAAIQHRGATDVTKCRLCSSPSTSFDSRCGHALWRQSVKLPLGECWRLVYLCPGDGVDEVLEVLVLLQTLLADEVVELGQDQRDGVLLKHHSTEQASHITLCLGGSSASKPLRSKC